MTYVSDASSREKEDAEQREWGVPWVIGMCESCQGGNDDAGAGE